MIIILILGIMAFYFFIAIIVACTVAKAAECKHHWVREVSDSGHYDKCAICGKIK